MSTDKNRSLNPAGFMGGTTGKALLKGLGIFVASLVAAWLYVWVYVNVLGFDLPKTVLLQKAQANWESRMELMDMELDACNEVLANLALRDDEVYRAIFGLKEIPYEQRNDTTCRYPQSPAADSMLAFQNKRLDILLGKAAIQQQSYSEVAPVAKRAGNMASCVPAIPPLAPNPEKCQITSPFGGRADPISGRSSRHEGIDFGCKPGYPVYVTGDGKVVEIKFELNGYGNQVLVDHGFGYKTRYAHLKYISVAEGMELKRGESIGTVGNSGKATGPHLHYEVLYMDTKVNPVSYFDMKMPLDEYTAMVKKAEKESGRISGFPSLSLIRKK